MSKFTHIWQLEKRVSETEELPRGYGVSWVDYLGNYAVCHPIPLNIIIGFWRNVWHWFKRGIRRSVIDSAIADSYTRGYDDGYKSGAAFGERPSRHA